MEVRPGVDPLRVRYAIDCHPELVTPRILAAVDRCFQLPDLAPGRCRPPFRRLQRTSQPVLIVHVRPPEPTETGYVGIHAGLFEDQRIPGR
jgi:hypothetical protein